MPGRGRTGLRLGNWRSTRKATKSPTSPNCYKVLTCRTPSSRRTRSTRRSPPPKPSSTAKAPTFCPSKRTIPRTEASSPPSWTTWPVRNSPVSSKSKKGMGDWKYGGAGRRKTSPCFWSVTNGPGFAVLPGSTAFAASQMARKARKPPSSSAVSPPMPPRLPRPSANTGAWKINATGVSTSFSARTTAVPGPETPLATSLRSESYVSTSFVIVKSKVASASNASEPPSTSPLMVYLRMFLRRSPYV